MLPLACFAAAFVPPVSASGPAADPVSAAPPRAAVERSVDAALAFLRAAQNPDGSFGDRQQRLQTGLAILAFLSSGATPQVDAASPLPKACAWLIANTGEDGFMGDTEYPLESHAVCGLAVFESIGTHSDDAINRALAARASAALQYTLTAQDKAVGAEFYGGWKIDPKSKVNDRVVTAWSLLLLRSAELRGAEVPRGGLTRALEFVEGAQHLPADGRNVDKLDRGGFSHDSAGLPVIVVTAAGLSTMSLFGRDAGRRDQALAWMSENPPVWFGPNFYTAHFFAARGLLREGRRTPALREQARRYDLRVWELLRDHQGPDGSYAVPPGNAENTKQMGATYATPMAVLILNAARGLLPVDAIR
ncbi:MAG: hypothetical protein NTW19_11735 [Planctomycetota bacterium]|nr:hypothetical protein [Planctomycetota bacterium]